MKLNFTVVLMLAVAAFSVSTQAAALTPEQLKALPEPAAHKVDFKTEIKPIFEASCIRCHGRGRNKGGLQIDSRETLLKGGDSGPAVVAGKSAESYLIALVGGVDPDSVMPKKGTKLTAEQVGVMRAWIDQGLPWDAEIGFGRVQPKNLTPRLPEIPAGPSGENPVDRFLGSYFAAHGSKEPKPVDDRLFARRVYLDITGMLPPREDLEAFVANKAPDKRSRLAQHLLEDEDGYATHWLTFWNDLLRNDYKGTGYIDGGRKQITQWLYSALLTNMPYDQFVGELLNPTPASEGFSKGIVWRGTVNASQMPQMQAAQNISQVFMGINLKCASCHDSFINDWQLSDSYGLANIYSDQPLEIFQCDKPTGKKAATKFLFPELGEITATTNKEERLAQLAKIVTCEKDGRLSRTIVNRIWARFMGRGLIEPVDDMEQTAWNQDLLDWLAEDLVSHHYDLKQTMLRIVTSRAYQLPAVSLSETARNDYVFTGPGVRRLSAEEFRDALTTLTGVGYSAADADIGMGGKKKARFALKLKPKWIWNTTNANERVKAGRIYLRKIVPMYVGPSEAVAFIECDNGFKLFINGAEAASGNDYTKPTVVDLKRWLKPGDNVIAVEAINNLPDNTVPAPGQTPPPGSENPAGFFLYARVRGADHGGGRMMDFATDKSWFVTEEKPEGWNQKICRSGNWSPASELGPVGTRPWGLSQDTVVAKISAVYSGGTRAALVAADPLAVALGRPNREQVVTTRASAATTLQALELTNGKTLADLLHRGAAEIVKHNENGDELARNIYEQAIGRKPTHDELKLAEEVIGQKPKAEGVEDFLWAVAMLPEFQLIY